VTSIIIINTIVINQVNDPLNTGTHIPPRGTSIHKLLTPFKIVLARDQHTEY